VVGGGKEAKGKETGLERKRTREGGMKNRRKRRTRGKYCTGKVNT